MKLKNIVNNKYIAFIECENVSRKNKGYTINVLYATVCIRKNLLARLILGDKKSIKFNLSKYTDNVSCRAKDIIEELNDKINNNKLNSVIFVNSSSYNNIRHTGDYLGNELRVKTHNILKKSIIFSKKRLTCDIKDVCTDIESYINDYCYNMHNNDVKEYFQNMNIIEECEDSINNYEIDKVIYSDSIEDTKRIENNIRESIEKMKIAYLRMNEIYESFVE